VGGGIATIPHNRGLKLVKSDQLAGTREKPRPAGCDWNKRPGHGERLDKALPDSPKALVP
jgi:hypothetical protein